MNSIELSDLSAQRRAEEKAKKAGSDVTGKAFKRNRSKAESDRSFSPSYVQRASYAMLQLLMDKPDSEALKPVINEPVKDTWSPLRWSYNTRRVHIPSGIFQVDFVDKPTSPTRRLHLVTLGGIRERLDQLVEIEALEIPEAGSINQLGGVLDEFETVSSVCVEAGLSVSELPVLDRLLS